MNDLLFNSRLLGAMSEHACLTEEEMNVLKDWAAGKSIANTSMIPHVGTDRQKNKAASARKV